MSHSNKFKLLCSWNFPLSTYLSFYLYGDFPPEASTDDALWCRKTMTLVCWLVIVDTICQLHNSIPPRDFKSVSNLYFLSFKICRSNAFCMQDEQLLLCSNVQVVSAGLWCCGWITWREADWNPPPGPGCLLHSASAPRATLHACSYLAASILRDCSCITAFTYRYYVTFYTCN